MNTLFLTLLSVIFWLMVWILPLVGLLYGAYFLISLPLRRQERARLFLQLIETGLKLGRTAENTVIAISQTQDQSMGLKFHRLAARLKAGARLGQAFDSIPQLLPPQIVAMIKVGEEIGDVRKVLPACRGLLKDGNSETRSAMNYVVILGMFLLPVLPSLTFVVQRTVIPKFHEIFYGALGQGMAAPSFDALRLASVLSYAQLGVVVGFSLCAFAYIAGPQSWKSMNGAVLPVGDWILYHLPWRRKRMQRDFSSMLALLLDAGVPEEKSLQLAAQSTANRPFIERSRAAVAALSSGLPITEAVSRLDDSGEFRWRLKTAAHNNKGFMAALAGWLEALDAKAFQQEQSAAHLITTSVVLFNGLVVGLFVTGIFSYLTRLVNEGVLW